MSKIECFGPYLKPTRPKMNKKVSSEPRLRHELRTYWKMCTSTSINGFYNRNDRYQSQMQTASLVATCFNYMHIVMLVRKYTSRVIAYQSMYDQGCFILCIVFCFCLFWVHGAMCMCTFLGGGCPILSIGQVAGGRKAGWMACCI